MYWEHVVESRHLAITSINSGLRHVIFKQGNYISDVIESSPYKKIKPHYYRMHSESDQNQQETMKRKIVTLIHFPEQKQQ